jgi:hypothetical protein
VLIWRPTCKLVLSSLQQRGGSVPFKPLVSLASPGIGSHLSTTSCLQHNKLLTMWYIFCLRLWAPEPGTTLPTAGRSPPYRSASDSLGESTMVFNIENLWEFSTFQTSSASTLSFICLDHCYWLACVMGVMFFEPWYMLAPTACCTTGWEPKADSQYNLEMCLF